MTSVLASVFKSLPVVHEVHRAGAFPGAAARYLRDAITLGWEERLRIRARRISDRGVEFATALPRGTILRQDDCLVVDALELVAVVVERAEPVFVISPATPSEWAEFAYHIGNSHQPMMLTEREIVCADLPGMDQVLDQHAIAFTRTTRPFTPIGQSADHRH